MNLQLDIQKKPNTTDSRKIRRPEDNFASMKQLSEINRNYTNDNLKFMNNALLIEENNSLTEKIKQFKMYLNL